MIDPAGATSTEALRFAHLMRNVEVNDQVRRERAAAVAPAKRRYVILFSPRSGSSWLTGILSATGKLGYPEEYLNPEFIVDVARHMHARTAADLLDSLIRHRKGPNNVFGLEARALDIDLLDYHAFAAIFNEDTLFFHLWRENLVAQAVSLFRAVETGHFHSTDAPQTAPPEYNAQAILLWMMHILDMENANVVLLRRLGAPARLLRYEDLAGRAQPAAEQFAHALAVPFSPGALLDPAQPALRKLADAWNAEAEHRLRRDHPGAIQQLHDRRLILRPVASPHPPPPAPPALEHWRRGQISGAAGRSPLNNPFEPRSPEGQIWRAGWARGWDTQVYAAE